MAEEQPSEHIFQVAHPTNTVLDDSLDDGDQDLDFVLQEAARLAAQMRSVAGHHHPPDAASGDWMIKEEDDEQEEEEEADDDAQVQQQLENRFDLSTTASTDFPVDILVNHNEQQPQEEVSVAGSAATFPSQVNVQATAKTATAKNVEKQQQQQQQQSTTSSRNSQSPGTSSQNKNTKESQPTDDGVSAAVRASEEMTKALQALGAPLPSFDEASSIGRTSVVEPQTPTRADASLSSPKTKTSPWKVYSMGLDAAEAVDTTMEARNPPQLEEEPTFQTDAPVNETQNKAEKAAHDSLEHTSKSQELRVKLRQTEAQYAMFKARTTIADSFTNNDNTLDENQTPNWLKMATLGASGTAPTSGNANKEVIWDKIDAPTENDDDFVALRDYSKPPVAQSQAHEAPKRSLYVATDLAQTRVDWDQINSPNENDEDYVPLRDYSKLTTEDAQVASNQTPPIASETTLGTTKDGVTWEKVESPTDHDDDYVPLRDYSKPVQASGQKPSKTIATAVKSPTIKVETQPPKDQTESPSNSKFPTPSFSAFGTPSAELQKINPVAGEHDFVPVKDYSVPRRKKSRSPSENVNYEKVDFCLQGDDDYVPLKDYSRLTPTTTSSASTATARSLSPGMLQFGEGEDEFERIVSAYQTKTYDEGPTAFELKRRAKRRKKRRFRMAVAAMMLLALMGAVYAYYQGWLFPRSSPAIASTKRRRSKRIATRAPLATDDETPEKTRIVRIKKPESHSKLKSLPPPPPQDDALREDSTPKVIDLKTDDPESPMEIRVVPGSMQCVFFSFLDRCSPMDRRERLQNFLQDIGIQ